MLNTTRIRDPQAGHVIEINLAENNLTGSLPASVSDFIFLKCVKGLCVLVWALCLFVVCVCQSLAVGVGVGVPPSLQLHLGRGVGLERCALRFAVLCLPWLLAPTTRHFYMNGNSLSGRIPVGIGSLIFLQIMQFSNNLLVGSIPSEIGGCERLEFLSLARNQVRRVGGVSRRAMGVVMCCPLTPAVWRGACVCPVVCK
jgi:hypothetical protein